MKVWYKVSPKISFRAYGKRVPEFLYFKTLDEVVDYFNLPSRQYASDVLNGSKNAEENGINSIVKIEGIVDTHQIAERIVEREIYKVYYTRGQERKAYSPPQTLSYWEKRIKLAQTYTDKNIEDIIHSSKGFYNEFYKHITKQILNLDLKSTTRTDIYNNKRYKALQAELNKRLGELYYNTTAEIAKRFVSQFQENASALGSDDILFHLDPNKMKAILLNQWCTDEKDWSQRLWKNQSNLVQRINQIVARTVVAGDSPTTAIKELQKEFGVTSWQAKRLIVTEASHVETLATQERYKQYGFTKWRILTAKDEKVCPICKSLAHKTYDLEDKPPIPAHPNCRDCMIPVVSSKK